MLKRIRIDDIGCVLLVMFFAIQGAIPGIAPNQALETNLAAPTPLMKVGGILSQGLVYGTIFFLSLRSLGPRLTALYRMRWALLLAAWVVCSTIWSIDPVLTARRSLAFLLAALFGFCLADRFSVQRQIQIFWWAMLLLAFATAAVAVAFPSVGLERSAGHAGDWQGVFTQKNACGRMMVLASAVALSKFRSWSRSLSLVFFLFVLVMSGSRGAWLLETVVLCCALFFGCSRGLHRRMQPALCAFLMLLLGGSACVLFFARAQLMQILGRDATLSGRLGIWVEVWQHILARPWLGYGYGAFWRGWSGPSYEVSAAVHFLVFHSHNGYLDLWLQTGCIGLLLFLATYLRAWRHVLARLQRSQLQDLFWPTSLLLIVGLYGIDENTLLIPNGLFWILFVMAVVQLEPISVLSPGRSLATIDPIYAKSSLPAR